MPMFMLWTNISKLPAGFFSRTTKLLASVTNKPEEKFMCLANSGQQIYFACSEEPTAFVTFSSIGIINPENNLKFSAAICEHVSKELGIEKDRVLIKFQNLDGSNVGRNGITLAAS